MEMGRMSGEFQRSAACLSHLWNGCPQLFEKAASAALNGQRQARHISSLCFRGKGGSDGALK